MADEKIPRECKRCRAVACTHVSRMAHRRTDVRLKCLHCGGDFTRKAWEIKRGRNTFCGRECSFAHGKPIEKKFWAKVDKNGPVVRSELGPCWVWTGTPSNKGYGETRLNGENCYAHRASYELHYGAIPDGLFVLHRCDNPPCVRPDHLFLGTQKDNMRDAADKGRMRTPKNFSKGSKLNPERVRAIREGFAEGLTYKELGLIHNVHSTMIGYVVTRKNWKHVS